MKNYQAIILISVLFINNCIAQTGVEKLFGTWVETHRDYVYFKTNMAYEFTKVETDIFKGSQMVFTKDTMFAYVTYLSENTMYPISYEIRDIKTDTVNLDRGNLSELLQKKGKYCKEITIKKNFFNGYKETFSEYGFYLFDDGSLAQLEDYSLHYFNKISSNNIGKWKKNEFGQTIISGSQWGNFDIPVKKETPYLMITYIPQKKGQNYFSVNKYNKLKYKYEIIHETDSKFNYDTENIVFKSETIERKLWISVGDPLNPIDSQWEVRYKFIDNVAKIQTAKSLIFSAPEIPTKMYLLKGDQVEVLKENNEWLNILYYGKKTIEGWIKKEDVK